MKNACLTILVLGAIFAPLTISTAQAQEVTDTASPGLAIGTRAPAFKLKDQFGQNQSNETLQGANGTVLLFVRSADL